MAFPNVLEIGLIMSIAAIMAVGLFTLYLLDRVQTRVESVEVLLNETRVTEDRMASSWQKRPSEFTSQGETSQDGTTALLSAEMQSIFSSLERNLLASDQRLKVLIGEIETSNVRANTLSNDLQAANRVLESLAKRVSETNDRLDALQGDVSKLARRLEEIEETITTIVRRSLQLKP